MKKSILTFLMFALLILMGCEKEKMPDATEAGLNTFACKINGSLFVSSKVDENRTGILPLAVENHPLGGFFIRGRKYKTETSPQESIFIKLPYLKTTGKHLLIDLGEAEYMLEYSFGPRYHTNSTYTGEVNITRCDTVNHIYSGSFSFTAIDEINRKIVKVTDGRFDVKVQ